MFERAGVADLIEQFRGLWFHEWASFLTSG